MNSLFHLAYNVTDLDAARQFYGELLGCREGRSTATWIDFDFFGHQISLHLSQPVKTENTGYVGEHQVPMPHLGVILAMPDWQVLSQRLTKVGMNFIITPTIRFVGEPGEQGTMFFRDPFGNAIEIKGFVDLDSVYISSGDYAA